LAAIRPFNDYRNFEGNRAPPQHSIPSPNGGIYMNLQDEINYADKKLIPKVFEIFGWKLQTFKVYQNLALVRADFYPVGHVLAISKKAVIVCEGKTIFEWNNLEYSDFDELLEKIGERAYSTFPEWNIWMEKEWTIRKNGEWILAFSNLSEMPYRKQVRC